MKTTTPVRMPEIGQDNDAFTLLGEHAVFVRIAHDQHCSNPLDDDAMGEIHSLSRRHSNSITREQFEALREEHGADLVVLGYYEHGQSMWFVSDEAPLGVEFQWDGVRVAGCWVPDKALDAELQGETGEARRARVLEYARQACEVYTQWVNGECYGFDVEVYKVRRDSTGEPYDRRDDYRRDKTEDEDSCWGYVGDSVLEATKEAVDGIVEGL